MVPYPPIEGALLTTSSRNARTEPTETHDGGQRAPHSSEPLKPRLTRARQDQRLSSVPRRSPGKLLGCGQGGVASCAVAAQTQTKSRCHRRAPAVGPRVSSSRRRLLGCGLLGGFRRREVLTGEVENVLRHLHEGGRDEVVEYLLDLRVALQVLVVIVGDRFLRKEGANAWLRVSRERVSGRGVASHLRVALLAQDIHGKTHLCARVARNVSAG